MRDDKVVPISFETPEQIRFALISDTWDLTESVVVIRKLNDGSIALSHSSMRNETLLWLAHDLIDYARYGDS